MTLKYTCMKCGTCCYNVPSPSVKRIPLYPEEVEKLILIGKEKGIVFQVIEDLVFPDEKNQKILVVTYRIKLDNKNQRCPFYKESTGCSIHKIKPMACKAYPLSLKQVDSFNFQISIDPSCNFIEKNYNRIKGSNSETIKEIFPVEFKNAQEHLRKNKKVMLKIKKLEYKGEIKIMRKISLEDFNRYLQRWDRVELKA